MTTNQTKPTAETNAWQTYREMANRVGHLIGVLELKAAEHRIRARGNQDEWLYDADLRSVEQLLEQTIEALGE